MRDTEFRGLVIRTKQWVHGDKCKVEDKHYIIPDGAVMRPLSPGIMGWGITGFIEVIPESVGQSTGLCDKNGKEVYHKDILEDRNKNRYTIEWVEIAARFVLMSIKDPLVQFSAEAIPKMSVIGNIHKNPELLAE